ncbi:MAG: PAS domain S-box protein [Lamprobacter sp.]|uniref:PAS domain-containing protein n=1 Tax=Lamprobacter sp. TaxID=3100796 RepID=UPI002B25C5F7|nr:PAS domain S-box protein [Lamprobacter sp.]MEA3641317.1 PAS domain S-box protein [Lamprobacter sp.]
MTKHDLAALLASITPPDAAAAHQFAERCERIVQQVDELMLARADLDALIGVSNHAQMHRNHRHHGAFMASLFADYDASRLLETVLWVLPAYQVQGFKLGYWDAQLAAWQRALADLLDADVWQQIAPLYAWMRAHLDTFHRLGLEEQANLNPLLPLIGDRSSDQMMMRIIQATPLAFCITDEQGFFEYTNPAYCTFYGYSPAELIGEHFTKIVHPAARQQLIELHDQFIAGVGEIRGEWAVIDRSGASRYVLADAVRILGEDGRPRKVTFIVDITQRKETEIALRESQARFARLTTQLGDRLFFFTNAPNGRLLYLSEGFKPLLGCATLEEAIGQCWCDLADWSPESQASVSAAHWLRLLQAEGNARFELSFRHPDGNWRRLEVHACRIFDQERELELIEGIALDVTEQRAQDARMRTLMRAVEQAPVSITVADTQGDILYVNPAFTQLSGYTSEEAIGKNSRFLQSGEQDDAFYEQLWATLEGGETWRGELINQNKQGRLYWAEAAISPVFDEQGVLQNYVAVKQDIKDRKELERIREDVERIMRHDLKAPLNAIINLPELLLMDDNLNAEQRKDIDLIRESGREMLDLIDHSLDLFKMESGQFYYRASHVDLMKIVQTTCAFIAEPLSCKQLSLVLRHNGRVLPLESTVASECGVAADARLLLSMLGNLMKNAVEASPAGETIHLDIREPGAVGDGANRQVWLEICNRGAVPAPMRERFFAKYSTHGKANGTGLGTYSAKLMADTMGLTLSMSTSDAEDRTCLRLRMPVSHQ